MNIITSVERYDAWLSKQLKGDIVRDDPGNPQANLRLGYVLLESDRCPEALRRFALAIGGHVPGADAYLGRARCELANRNDVHRNADGRAQMIDVVTLGAHAVVRRQSFTLPRLWSDRVRCVRFHRVVEIGAQLLGRLRFEFVHGGPLWVERYRG